MNTILQILSASSGLAGSIIIFIFGVANMTEHDDIGVVFCCKPTEEQEKSLKETRRKIELYKKISRLGLGLLILSFLFNLLGIINVR